jgi:hypothetical protein
LLANFFWGRLELTSLEMGKGQGRKKLPPFFLKLPLILRIGELAFGD